LDEKQAELVHRVLSIAQRAEQTAQESMIAIGKSMSELKKSKAYKGFYTDCISWRAFLLASGLKPQTIDQYRRIADRFADIIITNNLQVVPSRMAALLTIKHESPDRDKEIILESALNSVPHNVYKAYLDAYKGKSATPCQCETTGKGFETWHKMKCCGRWAQEQ
jgi:hypothetical protein